ncbi:MAG: substrate-binding domain-containing protein [Oscillibacter sp.]|nr:substrate-binding domain-containing protein [Oscillibacter sp.]
MGSRPTIQMVAELAGVSRGTVDRVLNDRPHVNEAVRQRVLAAMRELGYLSPREAYRRQADAALRPLTLGVLLPNWEGQFRDEVNQGLCQACEELEASSVRVLIRRCETDLPQEAAELLEAMRGEGAEGFAVCAVNDPAIQGWIAARMAEGIPCVTFNSDLPESGRLCFVGQSIRQAGRVAAGLLYKCASGRGPILATAGNLKFDGHRQRLDGFLERLEELGFPAEQVMIRETFNDYETTLRVVGKALEEQPELRGVYMANLSVSGCCAAIARAGKSGRVHVVCHDINESVRQLIRSGAVDFTIPQDLRRQGYAPLLLLRDHLRKKSPLGPGRQQIHILCAENLED